MRLLNLPELLFGAAPPPFTATPAQGDGMSLPLADQDIIVVIKADTEGGFNKWRSCHEAPGLRLALGRQVEMGPSAARLIG